MVWRVTFSKSACFALASPVHPYPSAAKLWVRFGYSLDASQPGRHHTAQNNVARRIIITLVPLVTLVPFPQALDVSHNNGKTRQVSAVGNRLSLMELHP